jgi:hypothetical protein
MTWPTWTCGPSGSGTHDWILETGASYGAGCTRISRVRQVRVTAQAAHASHVSGLHMYVHIMCIRAYPCVHTYPCVKVHAVFCLHPTRRLKCPSGEFLKGSCAQVMACHETCHKACHKARGDATACWHRALVRCLDWHVCCVCCHQEALVERHADARN